MPSAPPVLPEGEEDSPRYKRSLFDRQGPDATLWIKAVGYALPVFFLNVMLWGLIVDQIWHLTGYIAAAAIFACALCAAGLAAYVGMRFGAGAGAVVKAVTFPTGSHTPYEEQFSYQESMVARGDIAGALESYEAVIAERPGAILPRVRAAELYAQRAHNPVRAAELFREVRASPMATPRDGLYASSRLVDLYDGPLREPGRALVELRRIIELHPGSRQAGHARAALPGLKSRLASAQSDERGADS